MKTPERTGYNILKDRRGTTSLEYALIAALSAMVLIAGLISLGNGTSTPLIRLNETIQSTGPATPANIAGPGGACTSNCASATKVP